MVLIVRTEAYPPRLPRTCPAFLERQLRPSVHEIGNKDFAFDVDQMADGLLDLVEVSPGSRPEDRPVPASQHTLLELEQTQPRSGSPPLGSECGSELVRTRSVQYRRLWLGRSLQQTIHHRVDKSEVFALLPGLQLVKEGAQLPHGSEVVVGTPPLVRELKATSQPVLRQAASPKLCRRARDFAFELVIQVEQLRNSPSIEFVRTPLPNEAHSTAVGFPSVLGQPDDVFEDDPGTHAHSARLLGLVHIALGATLPHRRLSDV